ncbi:hypothetical protein JW868_02160 [Candidatus Woesearchaeota archaeon]|nr:hypothetical protein [Candidatus Woesearchaeota archaeon]
MTCQSWIAGILLLVLLLSGCNNPNCKNVTIGYTENVPVDGAVMEECKYIPFEYELLDVTEGTVIKNNEDRDGVFGYTIEGSGEEFIKVKSKSLSMPIKGSFQITSPPTKQVCMEGQPEITIQKVQRTQKFEVCFP